MVGYEIQCCKRCAYFGIKDRKMYWCFAPQIQCIENRYLLEIKPNEIDIRICELFNRKLM